MIINQTHRFYHYKLIEELHNAINYTPDFNQKLNTLVKKIAEGKQRLKITICLVDTTPIYNDPIDIDMIAPVNSRLLPYTDIHYSGDYCSICADKYDEGKQLYRVLPICKHSFHACCIDEWFKNAKK